MCNYCCLPELEKLDLNNWQVTQEKLYKLFKQDLIDHKIFFNGKYVNIRKRPYDENKEEAFYHVTCCDYAHDNNRKPDIRRSERIHWIRAFIENYKSCENCKKCSGIKIWSEKEKNKEKIYFFLEEKRYLVVLENRPNYYLLITGFYIEHDRYLKNIIKKFNQSQTQN